MIILRQRSFSFFDKLRSWADKANKKIDPNYKTEKEVIEERRKQGQQNRLSEERERDSKFSNLSRQHKILLDIEKKTNKFLPTWGDGDEYPQLILYKEDSDFPHGSIALGVQNEEIYTWDGKSWTDYYKKKKIYNLKAELLKSLNEYLREWNNITYLDKNEVDEVINYLNILIKEIKQSAL